jgi:hypothetical protein
MRVGREAFEIRFDDLMRVGEGVDLLDGEDQVFRNSRSIGKSRNFGYCLLSSRDLDVSWGRYLGWCVLAIDLVEWTEGMDRRGHCLSSIWSQHDPFPESDSTQEET